MTLVNGAIRQKAEKEGKSYVTPQCCYFSGYSGGDSFTSYWLDPGEETEFQVGWCLSDAIPESNETNTVYFSDTQGLALYVGNGGDLQGDCIELTE